MYANRHRHRRWHKYNFDGVLIVLIDWISIWIPIIIIWMDQRFSIEIAFKRLSSACVLAVISDMVLRLARLECGKSQFARLSMLYGYLLCTMDSNVVEKNTFRINVLKWLCRHKWSVRKQKPFRQTKGYLWSYLNILNSPNHSWFVAMIFRSDKNENCDWTSAKWCQIQIKKNIQFGPDRNRCEYECVACGLLLYVFFIDFE